MTSVPETDLYVRVCPICGAENPQHRNRCVCGASLVGVDFTFKSPAEEAEEPQLPAEQSEPQSATQPSSEAAPSTCPYADCGAQNPPGQDRCLYCNRPLHLDKPDKPSKAEPSADDLTDSNFTAAVSDEELPAVFRQRFTLIESRPVSGAEADLLHVRRIEDGSEWMLKLYRRGLVPNQQLVSALDRIQLPQILPSVERGIVNGRHWELMEFCPLGSLRQYLLNGPLPVEAIRRLVTEIYRALAVLHARKILHRDLKPENILIKSTDPLRIALIDFGIASMQQATQAFTSVARSIKYAPPASLTGVITAQADWWALGMIAMEAFLGSHPFDGLSEQVINYQLATRPVDTSVITDPDLQLLCRGLLIRDPARAWGGDEVKRWLENDPTLSVADDTGNLFGAVRPYNLGNHQCRTAQELGIAILKNWDAALKDWQRSIILRWVMDELNDQNLLRTIQDISENRNRSQAIQLLLFVHACDPKLPVMWAGRRVDFKTVLGAAANRSDADQNWLISLFDEKIPGMLEPGTDPKLSALAGRLDRDWARLVDFWKKTSNAALQWRTQPRLPGYDDKNMYEFSQRTRFYDNKIPQPQKKTLLADLILALNSPEWIETQRRTLFAGMAEVSVFCPWFSSIGDPAGLDEISVVAAVHLLAIARADAEMARQTDAAIKEEQRNTFTTLQNEFRRRLAALRRAAEPFPDNSRQITLIDEALPPLMDICEDFSRKRRPIDAQLAASIDRVEELKPHLKIFKEYLDDFLREDKVRKSGLPDWLRDVDNRNGRYGTYRVFQNILGVLFVASRLIFLFWRALLAGGVALIGGYYGWRYFKRRSRLNTLKRAYQSLSIQLGRAFSSMD